MYKMIKTFDVINIIVRTGVVYLKVGGNAHLVGDIAVDVLYADVIFVTLGNQLYQRVFVLVVEDSYSDVSLSGGGCEVSTTLTANIISLIGYSHDL